jgi:hypothetical protein
MVLPRSIAADEPSDFREREAVVPWFEFAWEIMR